MIHKLIQNDNNWIIWTANNIGDEGAEMISELLMINTTLTTLNLGCEDNVILNIKNDGQRNEIQNVKE